MAWKKINEKRYQLTINDEYVTIDVPYEKVSLIFEAFVTSGGVIDEQGKVQTDPIILVSNFRKMANILLTKYGPTGEVVEQGSCSMLSASEVGELFSVATDCLEGFMKTIEEMGKKNPSVVNNENADEEKTKKKKTTA